VKENIKAFLQFETQFCIYQQKCIILEKQAKELKELYYQTDDEKYLTQLEAMKLPKRIEWEDALTQAQNS
jgi:hypothetical protein